MSAGLYKVQSILNIFLVPSDGNLRVCAFSRFAKPNILKSTYVSTDLSDLGHRETLLLVEPHFLHVP